MKTPDRPTSYYSEKLESIIQKKEIELKESASKYAKHLAGKNLPALTDKSLSPFLGHIKSPCESLASLAHQYLMPLMHEAEHSIESGFAAKQHKRLDDEVQKLTHENRNMEFELANHDASVYRRIILASIIGFFICVGDTVYNIQSFQLITENIFFATLFSISCSVTALSLAHFIPMLYKKLTTRLGRIVFGSAMLTVITLFFSALAVFRTQFLQESEISVDSGWFILINMVFFLATMFISALLLPTWEELKRNWKQIKLRIAIRKQKKKIREIFKKKEKLRISEMEHEKHCVRVSHYMDSCNHRINKLYHECAETFKRDNIAYRSDNKVPDCMNVPLPDLEMKPDPEKPNDK